MKEERREEKRKEAGGNDGVDNLLVRRGGVSGDGRWRSMCSS